MAEKTVILGAGVAGLAAGIRTGATVYEASQKPGGICRSYSMGGYRFENGGGHWIFGGDERVLWLLDLLSPLDRYQRKASALIDGNLIPYPVQSHIPHSMPTMDGPIVTMKDDLLSRFGQELCDKFFFPFNSRYTAGLYTSIAPQDSYKNPTGSAGYNGTFAYPVAGLDHLVDRMASLANVEYGKKVVNIIPAERVVVFSDGTHACYDKLVSTLPLNVTCQMCGIAFAEPHTSVLVINIGAERGRLCPSDHWVYLQHSESGFHRIGFYSNVSDSFLPQGAVNRVCIYAEKAFLPRETMDYESIQWNEAAIIMELQRLEWIGSVDVADASIVDVAYTWKRPGGIHVAADVAVSALADVGIKSISRYGRWHFQGIAESIGEGLAL